MNIEQLRKNVGQLLRLQPAPVLVQGYTSDVTALTSDGPRLRPKVVDADYDWLVESVTSEGVTLHCLHTGHKITLRPDNVREYRSPNFLMLRCRLTLERNKNVRIVRIEPF